MKLILAVTLALGMLFGCTASKQAAYIAADTIAVSKQVDKVQMSLGEYSRNQDVLAELDEVQEGLIAALNGGTELLNLDIYYARATNIYKVLQAEAVERDDELTSAQRKQLRILDAQVLRLNNEVANFKGGNPVIDKLELARDILGITTKAITVVKFYRGLE